jgi:hypothetical protein
VALLFALTSLTPLRVNGAAADGAGDAAAPAAGDWIETPSYKFRFAGLKRCGAAEEAGAGAFSTLGFAVEVAPKQGQIFVSPRDVALERGGVILEARYLDQKPLPNCAPMLPQRQIRVGQSVRGTVMFDVPPSFSSGSGPIKLSYRPTRWGGAPRVEVKIPPCLDACAPPPADKERSPSRARKTPRGSNESK